MNKRLKNRLFFWGIFIILFLILLFFIIGRINNNSYVKSTGYSSSYFNRPKPDYTMSLKETNGSVDIYTVNFKSKSFMDSPALIYGLLFMPKDKKNIPGIVLLPGGSVTKESFIARSVDIANLGYAVLVIDQRGIGQTGGSYPSLQDDYEIYTSGKESIQHLGVYDGLAAYDVLRSIKNIDKNNIAIGGDSMGGRYAIIAAALDKRLDGVITVSSSGFHFKNDNQPYTPFLLSIDPDNYISKISPRPVLMLQGDNDTTVKLEDANYTFNLAKEPKRFFIAEGCGHGYCEKMADEFREDLNILYEKY